MWLGQFQNDSANSIRESVNLSVWHEVKRSNTSDRWAAASCPETSAFHLTHPSLTPPIPPSARAVCVWVCVWFNSVLPLQSVQVIHSGSRSFSGRRYEGWVRATGGQCPVTIHFQVWHPGWCKREGFVYGSTSLPPTQTKHLLRYPLYSQQLSDQSTTFHQSPPILSNTFVWKYNCICAVLRIWVQFKLSKSHRTKWSANGRNLITQNVLVDASYFLYRCISGVHL